MIEIGLSLPPAYLAGAASSGSAAVWYGAFGAPGPFLETLAGAGIGSIELRSVSPNTTPGEVLYAVQCVQSAGLRISVHGKMPAAISGADLDAVYPALACVRDALAAGGERVPLVLHCYSGREGNVDELARRTVLALRALLDVLDASDLPVQVALETNHISPNCDPGITYPGIVDMIDRVERPGIGACWDMGHTMMNVQHGQMPYLPPDAFLRRVIHTHIHDLGPDTHHPLTHGVVPVETYLDLLLARGYDGILDLELSPQRFPDAVYDGVWASIERLIAYRKTRMSWHGRGHGTGSRRNSNR